MSEANKTYLRFRVLERIEHFVLILSFTILGITGLPQKYAQNPVSQGIIQALGGIEATRVIHHIAAAVFLLEAVYHLVIVGYKIFVQNKEASMLPGIKDATDAAQWFQHNVGLSQKMPKMPRYNFMEKAEYWAMLWGLFLMGLTGLMLWNPIATTNMLPGEIIPAAKAAHGAEAVLAVLAIILWHFYNVHLKRFNWSMFRGTLSHEEMEEEHAAELAQIESGKLPQAPAPEIYRKRLLLFVPTAAVFSIVLVGLTYYFLTFETTSITTLPPAERVAVFAPQTPTPAPTSAPTSAPDTQPTGGTVAWTGTIETMMQDKCVSCHGSMGGFNAETYNEVMKAVQAGSPDDSVIVQVQKAGDHPGQLSEDELNVLVDWIQAGAPQGDGSGGESGEQSTPTADGSSGESGEQSTPTADGSNDESGEQSTPTADGSSGESGEQSTPPAGAETWTTGMEELFNSQCGACHGTAGGFTATAYEDVMKGITPGDPNASQVVEVQQAGDHPGMFSEDELNRVIEWIEAGAPQ